MGGVHLSTNDGGLWTAKNIGMMDIDVSSIAKGNSNIFAGTYNSGLFLSTNNGDLWTRVNIPASGIYSLAISGANIFAGTDNGMYLSINNGSSWTALNTGLPNAYDFSIAIRDTNIFIGTKELTSGAPIGRIFLSANNGGFWSAANTGLPLNPISSLVISGSNIFAGTIWGGVFLSTNNGGLWTAVNTGLTTNIIYSLAINGTNIFAGTDNGVYFSNNNGGVWNAASTGLTTFDIWSLAIVGTNIFAGTDAGVWIRPLSEIVGIDKLSEQNSVNIAPNPFNSHTKINFAQEQKNTMIKIMDVFGKEIKMINFTGNELIIERGEMHKGIYFVQLIDCNKNVANRKIIVQ